MLKGNLYLPDEAATEAFGRRLAAATGSGELAPPQSNSDTITTEFLATKGGCVTLHGDLGSGKTTLVRGLMRGYGYQGAVKSPTYTLVEPYEFSRFNIYHFDLYRLSDPGEVEYLGVSDYFSATNLCLIEWPDQGRGWLPAADLEITLAIEGTGRQLSWVAETARGKEIAAGLSGDI